MENVGDIQTTILHINILKIKPYIVYNYRLLEPIRNVWENIIRSCNICQAMYVSNPKFVIMVSVL